MIPKLREIFYRIDVDRSGTLSRDELLDAPASWMSQLQRIVTEDLDIMTLFDVLDVDFTGEVEIDEFCYGILCLSQDKAVDDIRMLKQLASMHHKVAPRGARSLLFLVWRLPLPAR